MEDYEQYPDLTDRQRAILAPPDEAATLSAGGVANCPLPEHGALFVDHVEQIARSVCLMVAGGKCLKPWAVLVNQRAALVCPLPRQRPVGQCLGEDNRVAGLGMYFFDILALGFLGRELLGQREISLVRTRDERQAAGPRPFVGQLEFNHGQAAEHLAVFDRRISMASSHPAPAAPCSAPERT